MPRLIDNPKAISYPQVTKTTPFKGSDTLVIPSSDIIIGVSLLAWVYLIIQSFQFAVEGSAADFGPGMMVFDWLYQKSKLLGEYGYSVWSICVTKIDAWGLAKFARTFLMWQIMIGAMMLPTLLLRIQNNLKFNASYKPLLQYLAGYLFIWMLFSIPMVIVQWGLQVNALLNNGMSINQPLFSAMLLIFLGITQLRILKKRATTKSLSTQKNSTFISGFHGGLDCIKFSWPLMISMFAFGLMNIIYMAALTILMMALFKKEAKQSTIRSTV